MTAVEALARLDEFPAFKRELLLLLVAALVGGPEWQDVVAWHADRINTMLELSKVSDET